MLNTKYKGQTGLMYAFSRNECEKLSEMLQQEGIKADFYHAGLSSKKRNEIKKNGLMNYKLFALL